MSDSECSSYGKDVRNLNVFSDAGTSDSDDELVVENSGIFTGSRSKEKMNMSAERIINKNKKPLKTLVKESMADKGDFSTASDVLLGNKSLSNDNSNSKGSVMLNGRNFMTLSASAGPNVFGRKLATELLGQRSKSELECTLIGKARRRERGRRDHFDPDLRKKLKITERKSVCIFGDSHVKRMSEAFSKCQNLPFDLTFRGVSGLCLRESFHYIPSLRAFDLVIVQCGGNDITFHPRNSQVVPDWPKQLSQTFKDFLEQLGPDVSVILMPIIDRPAYELEIMSINLRLKKRFRRCFQMLNESYSYVDSTHLTADCYLQLLDQVFVHVVNLLN